MNINYSIPDRDGFEPDAYDAEGNLTVNSWELFRQDEEAYERYKEDEEDA